MKWTINKAAQEWGIDRRTLTIRLTGIGFTVGNGSKFHTRDISRAIVGELEREKILETQQRRMLLEMEVKERGAELVKMSEVEKVLTDTLLPVRQRLLALPAEAAARCNPSDPQFAREALQRWVDDSLPAIRDKFKKP